MVFYSITFFCYSVQTETILLVRKLGHTKSNLPLNILTLTNRFFLYIKLFPGKNVCKSVNHGCEHVCVNADNSYICKCREGFVLREDGKTCRSEWLVSIEHFCMYIRQGRKGVFFTSYKLPFDSYISLTRFHSKPTFISIISRTGHLQISQPWLWAYLC